MRFCNAFTKNLVLTAAVGARLEKWLSVMVVAWLCLGCAANQDAGGSASKAATDANTQRIEELCSILASPSKEHADKWTGVQEIRVYGRKATGSLVRLLEEEDKGNGHYYAIRALGYIRDPNATKALGKILLDRKYGPRRYAGIALGQIGDPCAVGPLSKALNDVPHVRADTLDALVKIDSNEGRKVLEDYHFGNAGVDLELEISCDKRVYMIGDETGLRAKGRFCGGRGESLSKQARFVQSCNTVDRSFTNKLCGTT